MKRLGFVLLLAALAAPVVSGCDLFLGDTKMGKGVLYQSGEQKYDPFFEEVHKEQLAAAEWPDQAKASRKPIVSALNLKPDASNGTILSATREAKEKKTELGSPVDQTTVSENERAKKMTAEAKRLEDLKERGAELKKQAAADRDNMGAQKADDKAVEKRNQVKREIAASVDAVDKMISDANRAAREAEELATKLPEAAGHAVDAKPKQEETADADKEKEKEKEKPKKPEKKPKPAAPATAPAPKPAAAPAAAPAPAPKPAPKPAPDEVFNP